MSERPYDVLLDDYPYEKMTDAMLEDMAATGDEEAEAELKRRSLVDVLGPGAVDKSPVESVSEEVLIKRLAAGDGEAEAEFDRRHGLQ